MDMRFEMNKFGIFFLKLLIKTSLKIIQESSRVKHKFGIIWLLFSLALIILLFWEVDFSPNERFGDSGSRGKAYGKVMQTASRQKGNCLSL